MALSRADSIRVAEVVIARDVAALESAHGDRIVAANMFLKVLLSFHRAGDLVNMTVTFGELARHFAAERPAVAATLHGTAMANPAGRQVRDRVRTETQLRNALGEARFEALAAKGAELRATDAVEYAAAQLAG